MKLQRIDRYQSLDVWRGISCLMIVVFHASLSQLDGIDTLATIPRMLFRIFGAGWIGVSMFFVISGYCISASCQARKELSNAFTSFLRRRYKRIFPPVWVLMASVVCVNALFPKVLQRGGTPVTLSVWQWAGNASLTESFRHHFGGGPEQYIVGLGHLWSLCYEEQFYGVCAIGILVAPKRFFLFCASVTGLVSSIVAWMFISTGGLDPIRGFFFDGQWILFAFGVLVYWLLNCGVKKPRIGAVVLGGGSSLLLVGVIAGLLPAKVLAWQLVVAAWLSCALILLRPLDSKITRRLPMLARCGQMSYSVYLVHLPITKAVSAAAASYGLVDWWHSLFFSVPLGLALSLTIAAIFHRFVEVRFWETPARLSLLEEGGDKTQGRKDGR